MIEKYSSSLNPKNIFNQNEKILTKKNFWCAASTHKGEELFCVNTHLILNNSISLIKFI